MNKAGTYSWKAFQCFRKGNYDGAIENYNKVIEVEGDSVSSHYFIAACQEYKQDYNEAIRSAENALKCDQNHFDSLVLLTRLYYKSKDYKMVKEYAVRGLEAYPKPETSQPIFSLAFVKLLGLFPKFKRASKSVSEVLSNPNHSNEKWYKWAKEFLEWYEKETGEKSIPTIH